MSGAVAAVYGRQLFFAPSRLVNLVHNTHKSQRLNPLGRGDRNIVGRRPLEGRQQLE